MAQYRDGHTWLSQFGVPNSGQHIFSLHVSWCRVRPTTLTTIPTLLAQARPPVDTAWTLGIIIAFIVLFVFIFIQRRWIFVFGVFVLSILFFRVFGVFLFPSSFIIRELGFVVARLWRRTTAQVASSSFQLRLGQATAPARDLLVPHWHSIATSALFYTAFRDQRRCPEPETS